MTTAEQFGKKLKELRKETGVLQDDFAKAVGVTKGTVSKWETGTRMPEFATLDTIADYFNTTVAYLTGTSGERFAPEPLSDQETAASMMEDEADRLKRMVMMIARLSEGSKRIVAATVAEAYKRDASFGILEDDGFEISINSKKKV